MAMNDEPQIQIFSTTPQSGKNRPRDGYIQQIIDVARWSEQAGCTAILVYTDNSLVDALARVADHYPEHAKTVPSCRRTARYMHPYTVAKLVATFGHLYQRRVYLNLVAGGFKNDLLR